MLHGRASQYACTVSTDTSAISDCVFGVAVIMGQSLRYQLNTSQNRKRVSHDPPAIQPSDYSDELRQDSTDEAIDQQPTLPDVTLSGFR